MARIVRGAETEVLTGITAPGWWEWWVCADGAFVTLVGGMSVRRNLCIESECGGKEG